MRFSRLYALLVPVQVDHVYQPGEPPLSVGPSVAMGGTEPNTVVSVYDRGPMVGNDAFIIEIF